ncbi:hypothetical protein [Marinibacterium sp. SX1]|uniref:hypothetical protein n=1 Tax=Marinibacterium sp. SX1 TaxID=3388424 RepID=UPI003D186E2A
MSVGLLLGLLLGLAFLCWAGSLALFWMVFRSWQYLVDAMSRCPAPVLRRIGWPVLSPFDEGAEATLPRSRSMALQARVFIFDLPGDCPEDALRLARRFRRAVLALTVLLCALTVVVTRLEPGLLGAGRVFFAVLLGWGLLHLALLWRWRLWPGQQREAAGA